MRHRSFALIAALLLAGCQGEAYGPAEFVGAWTWEPRISWYGGFSGLDTADGTEVALVSDSGYFVLGRFDRTDGAITGLSDTRTHSVKRPRGAVPFKQPDTEGLALHEGAIFVSVERTHELWRFEAPDGFGTLLPQPEAARDLAENASLEALAVAPDGALYTLPEAPGADGFPLWRLAGGVWSQVATLPAQGEWRAVGADFGPDGRFYLLERAWHLPLRFATRIRRFDLSADPARGEVLLTTPPGRHDNLEGMAVWREPGGALRLTMVSDDNFLALQRTEFVEYQLPDRLATAAARR